MKYFSNIKPDAIGSYSAGKSYVNYNVEETQRTDPEGETVTEYQFEQVVVQNPCDYPAIVSAIIRTRYTADQVEAIVLNGGDTHEHKAELEALQQWRTEAKRIAKEVLALQHDDFVVVE